MSLINSQRIPTDLLLYEEPENWAYGNGEPNWQVNKMGTNEIIVKRAPLFPISSFYLAAIVGILFSALVYAIGFLPLDNETRLVYRIVCPLIVVMTIIAIPLMLAYVVHCNSVYWGTIIRFSYNPTTELLKFARENKTYLRHELQNIIICCIWGFDTETMERLQFGLLHTGEGLSSAPRTQCFFLIQTNDFQWHRHLIGQDLARTGSKYGSPPFENLVKYLQPLTNCEVFFKKYTIDECYDQQRGLRKPDEDSQVT